MNMKRRLFSASLFGVVPSIVAVEKAMALPFLFKKKETVSCVESVDLSPAAFILLNLKKLENIHHGFPVDQLTHGLQTATRARREGLSNEMIVASLCHDMGKVISTFNHEAIAAEILRPYISDDVYNMLRHHGIFQGRFFWDKVDRDPEMYKKYKDEPWFDLCMKFTADLDAPSFDKDYPTDNLESFVPEIEKLVNGQGGQDV